MGTMEQILTLNFPAAISRLQRQASLDPGKLRSNIEDTERRDDTR